MSSGEVPMELATLKRPFCEDEQPKVSPLNLKGTQFLPTPTPTVGSNSSEVMADQRHSPAPSESDLSSIQEVSSIAAADRPLLTPSANGPPPAKRVKLTPAERAEREAEKQARAQEKEAKRQEREAKKQEQAEAKAARDSEKLMRDQEKQKKAEERESKKREKELEEERKVQAKLKKERSQMRLGAFFQPPATTGDGADHTTNGVRTRSRSLSLEAFDENHTRLQARSRATSPVKQTGPPEAVLSEYKQYFLPFEVRPHTILAKSVSISTEDIESTQRSFDAAINSDCAAEEYDLGLRDSVPDIKAHFNRGPRRKCRLSNVRQICETAQQLGISTTDASLAELASVPIRFNHFVDVYNPHFRPPYHGTFTSIRSTKLADSLRLNPFLRCRTDTNYDYDSEAEWEEGGEGEDLDGDEEDEESVEDPQEMDEFLDDENDELAARRRIVVSDLEPYSTGLCWQDRTNKYSAATGTQERELLASLRLQLLLPNVSQIDPFSSTYWTVTKPVDAADNSLRPPLAERSSNTPSKVAIPAWPIHNTELANKRGPKAGAQKTMSSAEFEEFKKAVIGSQLSKLELINSLKVSFPKLTANLVKNTLGESFAQMGKTKADKKWVYVSIA